MMDIEPSVFFSIFDGYLHRPESSHRQVGVLLGGQRFHPENLIKYAFPVPHSEVGDQVFLVFVYF